MLSAVLIASRGWLLPAGVFLLAAVALLAWNYRRGAADRKLRLACAALKLLGLAAILACLLEPFWTGQRARPGANHFAVLADNSQGLTLRDKGASQTRGQHLAHLLAPPQAGWLEDLAKDFQVRRYLFDTRLLATRDFSELDFNGRSTALSASLRSLADRFRGQPLAGVLLFTDGNATDLTDGQVDLAGLPPIYPVVIGTEEAVHDIAIQKMALSQTSFEDAPVSLQADVVAGGYKGRMIVAQLMDQAGRRIQQQTQTAGRDVATFRFHWRPEQVGLSFYALRVAAQDELGQFDRPETTAEATLANNTRTIVVRRGQGPYRILYVSGRPNWEFKFLNRALAADDQVELTGLIRVARREPKFEFRGRAGETSNPLFRGFDRKNEETERYDQPVLISVNAKDPAELAAGFPKTAEVLFRFQAIILDDLEAEFFTRDQMALLQRFVSERGGGFLMLGGAESFRQGHYEHTPVGELLPVYLDALRDDAPASELRLSLTREGWLQPWARLRDNEPGETRRLSDMPPLQVLNTVRGVKPGATIIAEVQDATGRKHPALVQHRFGRGRVGALLVGDWWRWGLRDEGTRKDLDKAWRQLIRWLLADVTERVELVVEPKVGDPNQAMALQVRARDKEFQPLDNATAKLSVVPLPGILPTNVPPAALLASTQAVHLVAEPALTEPGRYEAAYVPRTLGGHLAEVTVNDGAGIEVGRAQAGWAADPAAEEFRSLTPNRALLENIARQTGGEVVPAGRLGAFVASLPARKAPVTENWSLPLWHQPVVLLFALACFAAEWGLRRWKGLA